MWERIVTSFSQQIKYVCGHYVEKVVVCAGHTGPVFERSEALLWGSGNMAPEKYDRKIRGNICQKIWSRDCFYMRFDLHFYQQYLKVHFSSPLTHILYFDVFHSNWGESKSAFPSFILNQIYPIEHRVFKICLAHLRTYLNLFSDN